jgi:hypothetical protein
LRNAELGGDLGASRGAPELGFETSARLVGSPELRAGMHRKPNGA